MTHPASVRARSVWGMLAGSFSCFALANAGMAPPASANTIAVTNLNDNGAGSLRQTIAAAAADDTVTVPAGQITLTSGALAFSKNLTITGAGAGATVISGNDASRAFTITGTPTVTLVGLTVTHGKDPSGAGINAIGTLTLEGVVVSGNHAGGGGVAGFGGGIEFGPGTLSLINSAVSDNTAGGGTGGPGFGGGIDLAPSANGQSFTLTLTRSRVSGNHAGGGDSGFGAGIDASTGFDTGSISIALTDSSLSGNVAGGGGPEASGFGGGVELSSGGKNNALTLTLDRAAVTGNTAGGGTSSSGVGGGIYFTSGGSGVTQTLTVTNSTIAANSAGGMGSSGFGGGIDFGSGSATLAYVTVAGNSAGGGGGSSFGGGLNMSSGSSVRSSIVAANPGGNCSPAVTSAGHNIEDAASCGFTGVGDKPGVNPLLGSLQNNGGATQTQELLAGSPAIDAGDNFGCPATDQRGLARPQGPACDIGALEIAPPAATTGAATGVGTTSATLAGSASNPSVANGSLFFQFGTSATYGSQTPAQPLAGGVSGAPFSTALSTLMPGVVYHFRAVATTPDGTRFGADETFTTAHATTTTAPPVIAKVTQSHRSWREGNRLASFARKRKAPLGTTFSFTLNEHANVSFAFTQQVAGHKVKGKCVAKTKKNRRKPSCKRTVTQGTLSFTGHTGTNKVSFQGRVSASKRLRPGRYTLLITATNAAGQRSRTQSLSFTIVK